MLYSKHFKHSRGSYLKSPEHLQNQHDFLHSAITLLLLGSVVLLFMGTPRTTAIATPPVAEETPQVRVAAGVYTNYANGSIRQQDQQEQTTIRKVRDEQLKAQTVLLEAQVAAAEKAKTKVRKEAAAQKSVVDGINHYLAGSPLAGKGAIFVAAAEKYGINPHLSPAIANIESGKGSHCANSYNAWGMRGGSGWQGFSSWKAAIYAHAELIGNHYGGSHATPESMAHKYCPPTWRSWAGKVRSEISRM